MFSGKGYFLANQSLDYNLGGTSYTPPATVYLALFNAPILVGGTGAVEVTSVGGTAYARVAIPNTPDQWSTATNGAKSNLKEIIFAPASLAWGIVVAAAIMDAPTGGNIMYYGNLVAAINVQQGDSPQFLGGTFVVIEALST